MVVGKSVADRYPEARIGRKVKFGRGDWDVVGVMDAGRGAQHDKAIGTGLGARPRRERGDRAGRADEEMTPGQHGQTRYPQPG